MTSSVSTDIAANLQRLRERVTSATARAGRDAASVTIVGASKTMPPEVIAQAHAAGLRDFGENWIQEAQDKHASFAALDPRPTWHLIGHLQTNKVPAALRLFDVVQTIDSLRLAEAISRRATTPVRVLIEVNAGGEASKSGIAPAEVEPLLERLRTLPNLAVTGLMTVAPQAADPEEVRPVFRLLRELRDRCGLQELSMGMTEDFEVAIEEGATLVRVGRALFGARPA